MSGKYGEVLERSLVTWASTHFWSTRRSPVRCAGFSTAMLRTQRRLTLFEYVSAATGRPLRGAGGIEAASAI